MGKKFVIRSANLKCQYGAHTSELKPFLDQRVQVNFKNLANASDIRNFNVCGGFGIVTLMDSGQPDANHAEEMLKKLEELEHIVDEYMEANNIPENKWEGLLESVLLWKGYAAWDTCWEYKSTEENRAFCAYLQKKHPLLANYFGGGVYIVDKNGETIDLSYMLGMNKALNNWNEPYAYVTAGMIGDRGMYNGYLEACLQQRGQGTGEALGSFLGDFMGGSYDADGRYNQYYNGYYDVVDDDLRYCYCSDAGINQGTLSVAEQNEEVIKGSIASQMQDQGMYDAETSKKVSGAFVEQLQKDVQKGG